MAAEASAVQLEPWGLVDRGLLREIHGDPAMMEHLGGPEGGEKLEDRLARYVESDSGMFRVVETVSGESAGSAGFWERTWRDEDVFEMGWSVLPAFQGRGIAVAAAAAVIEIARKQRTRRAVHAFPSVANAASNAICSKLGLRLIEECDFEFPPGHLMRCNDWRLELD